MAAKFKIVIKETELSQDFSYGIRHAEITLEAPYLEAAEAGAEEICRILNEPSGKRLLEVDAVYELAS